MNGYAKEAILNEFKMIDQLNRRIIIRIRLKVITMKNEVSAAWRKWKYKLGFSMVKRTLIHSLTHAHTHAHSKRMKWAKEEKAKPSKKSLLMIDVWCNRHRCIHHYLSLMLEKLKVKTESKRLSMWKFRTLSTEYKSDVKKKKQIWKSETISSRKNGEPIGRCKIKVRSKSVCMLRWLFFGRSKSCIYIFFVYFGLNYWHRHQQNKNTNFVRHYAWAHFI